VTDPVDALVADLLSRSEKEWELLIIADWPIYSVSGWPKERLAPFAPVLPPESWCRGVRDQREAVFRELRKLGRGAAIDAAEERAKKASTEAAVNAASKWTDMLGIPMHVQAAKSVLWIVALYPDLTNRQFRALWEAYASVAPFLVRFEHKHLAPRPDAEPAAAPSKGLLGRLFGRG
jgi:hypothetical protein